MSSELFLQILFGLFFVLLPGAIVLTALGDKFKKRAMFACGVVLICATLLAIIVVGLFTGLGFFYILLFPLVFILIAALALIWLAYSIYLIVMSFKEHKGGSVALGFIFVTLDLVVVIVPFVLISIFGLPISFM